MNKLYVVLSTMFFICSLSIATANDIGKTPKTESELTQKEILDRLATAKVKVQQAEIEYELLMQSTKGQLDFLSEIRPSDRFLNRCSDLIENAQMALSSSNSGDGDLEAGLEVLDTWVKGQSSLDRNYCTSVLNEYVDNLKKLKSELIENHKKLGEEIAVLKKEEKELIEKDNRTQEESERLENIRNKLADLQEKRDDIDKKIEVIDKESAGANILKAALKILLGAALMVWGGPFGAAAGSAMIADGLNDLSESDEGKGGDETGGDETGGDETGGDETGGDETGGDDAVQQKNESASSKIDRAANKAVTEAADFDKTKLSGTLVETQNDNGNLVFSYEFKGGEKILYIYDASVSELIGSINLKSDVYVSGSTRQVINKISEVSIVKKDDKGKGIYRLWLNKKTDNEPFDLALVLFPLHASKRFIIIDSNDK